jgi:serine/threonine protein kinase/Flp pilus assembly protein TadD
MIGQTISQYRILDKLGEGGMGTVYLAEHTLLGRLAAIKFLKDSNTSAPDKQHLRARFLREAHALSTFSHPHIASVYDYGETQEGNPYIIMEWVDGQTLGDLQRKGKLSLSQSLKIIEHVAEALAEAHRHSIIHRDIKPSNIVINERGQVKVLDFGLAKHVNSTTFSSESLSTNQSELLTQTRKGFIPGTPHYMSPEQALGQNLDARSDIFSLGVLLYECITGEHAFSGINEIEIYTKVVRDNPPPPSQKNPEVPPRLDGITLKCLAKSTAERYQSVEELLSDLRAVDAKVRNGRGSDRQHTWLFWGRFQELIRGRRFPVLGTRLYIAAFLGTLILGAALWHAMLSYGISDYQPPAEALRWYEKGTTALHDGTYYKADKLFEEAVKLDGNFALAHARLAETRMELDYTDKAKDELIRVGELTSDQSKLSHLDGLRLQAITSTVRRDFAKTAEIYRAIIPLVSESEKPSVHVDLGRAYENNEELERAIEQYSKAAELDKQYAAAFMRLGVAYGRRQDVAQADAAFDQAFRLFQLSSDIEGVTEVLYQRGVLYNKLDRLADAQQQLQQALDMGQASISKSQWIKLTLQLSSVIYSDGKPSLAQQRAREATELAQVEGLENLTTNGLIDVGNSLMWQGKYNEAEEYFKQAVQIARINKGLRGEARARLALGSLYVQQGDAGKALTYIEPAHAFYQQGNYRKETSQALLLLGRANEFQGNYENAIKAYEQEIKVATQLGDLSQAAYAHVYLGSLLSYNEKFPQALAHFDESYRIDTDRKADVRIGYDLLNRGNILWQLGHYDEAKKALGQASALASQRDNQNNQLLAWVLLFDAQMSLSERRFEDAISKSQHSLSLAGTQYKDVAAQATSTLGVAQALSGMQGAGMRSCLAAVNLAKTVRVPRLISSGQLALAEVQLESGHMQDALKAALALQESFARSGQQQSQWRAWLIAALAMGRQGDQTSARNYAEQADKVLTEMHNEWGEEAFTGYVSRPDIHYYRRQLNEVKTRSQ